MGSCIFGMFVCVPCERHASAPGELTSGSLGLLPFDHEGSLSLRPPSFCWSGHAVVMEMYGFESSVLLEGCRSSGSSGPFSWEASPSL